MKIFYSSKCLEYMQPGHPESPDRISRTSEHLRQKGFSFHVPNPCSEEDILRVHTRAMLDGIKEGTQYDGDTPPIDGILNYAKLSAGATIQAAETATETESAFSLMRPPGHHALKDRVMGFCYLNNIAIATTKYLERHPQSRVAILDIDCHHGNGTEAIFRNHHSVLYVSLHQSPLYPGTGLQSHDNCHNFPLQPDTGEKTYLDTLEKGCEIILQFSPNLLGISAGFDTYAGDPLSQFDLQLETYTRIGDMIAKMKIPLFVTLEGGYSQNLPDCVFAFIQGLDKNNHCIQK